MLAISSGLITTLSSTELGCSLLHAAKDATAPLTSPRQAQPPESLSDNAGEKLQGQKQESTGVSVVHRAFLVHL